MGKKTNHYWGIKQEELIKKYIEEENLINKERILIKLRPALRRLIVGVLQRYYRRNYRQPEERNHIYDTMNHVILKLPKFNPEKGKGFAYCGTVARRFLYNQFVPTSEQAKEYKYSVDYDLDAIDIDSHPKLSYIDDAFDKYNEEETISLIKKKLFQLRKLHTSDTTIEMIDIMIEIINEGFESFNGFILEVARRFDRDEVTYIYNLRKCGIEVDNFFGLYRTYDDVKCRIRETTREDVPNWELDDFTPISNSAFKARVRKKINKYY